MKIQGIDYYVYFAELPMKIHGMVSPNADGTYTIILNSRLSDSKKREALKHELEHIEYDDFYNSLPIEVVEDL